MDIIFFVKFIIGSAVLIVGIRIYRSAKHFLMKNQEEWWAASIMIIALIIYILANFTVAYFVGDYLVDLCKIE